MGLSAKQFRVKLHQVLCVYETHSPQLLYKKQVANNKVLCSFYSGRMFNVVQVVQPTLWGIVVKIENKLYRNREWASQPTVNCCFK